MILITGGRGKLGKELSEIFPDSLTPTREELNITDSKSMERFFQSHKPDIVIHTAALASVTECENNKELAWKTNYEGTHNLINACEYFLPNCYFIYISTACVFQGDRGYYSENDIPNPKNFYSMTKLLGELALENSKLSKWLIIRTNFVAREKWPYPKAFIDRFGNYLFADDVAQAIQQITKINMTGIIHVNGDKRLSMYELAKLTTPGVQPMTLEEYKGPPVTVDMTLKSNKIPPFKMTV